MIYLYFNCIITVIVVLLLVIYDYRYKSKWNSTLLVQKAREMKNTPYKWGGNATNKPFNADYLVNYILKEINIDYKPFKEEN